MNIAAHAAAGKVNNLTDVSRYSYQGQVIGFGIGAAVGVGMVGPSGTLVNEFLGAAQGGISAAISGGDVTKGIIFGTVVGGVSGATSKALQSFTLGPYTGNAGSGALLNNFTRADVLAQLILRGGGSILASGAVAGSGFGAISAYQGGRGDVSDILRGAGRGAIGGMITNTFMAATSIALAYAKISPLNVTDYGVDIREHTVGSTKILGGVAAADINQTVGGVPIMHATALSVGGISKEAASYGVSTFIKYDVGLAAILGGLFKK